MTVLVYTLLELARANMEAKAKNMSVNISMGMQGFSSAVSLVSCKACDLLVCLHSDHHLLS